MVKALKVAGVTAPTPKGVEHFERLAEHNMDVRIRLIRHVDELLLRVW